MSNDFLPSPPSCNLQEASPGSSVVTSLVPSITSQYQKHGIRTIQCTSCGELRAVTMDCDDRFCKRCNRRRAVRIKHRYLPRISKFQSPKLVTLTYPRRPFNLASIKRLRRDFDALRRSPVWKARAGIYAIETGQVDSLGQVNLHLHAIVDSDFIPQSLLSAEWRRITGDSFVVDIRKCWSQYGAVRYLQDYVTKVPEDSPKWFKDRFNLLFRSTRLIQSFGDFGPLEAIQHTSTCSVCGSHGSYVCIDYDASLEGMSPRGPPIQIADAIARGAS